MRFKASLLILGISAFNSVPAHADRCRVQFDYIEDGTGQRPLVDGAHVGLKATLHGHAVVPPGKFLWVFAHRQGIQLWWPQGGGSPMLHNNAWNVWVQFGRPGVADAGNYEVTARVVDGVGNAKLLNWVATAASQDYPPIPLPFSVEGCTAKTLTLQRDR